MNKTIQSIFPDHNGMKSEAGKRNLANSHVCGYYTTHSKLTTGQRRNEIRIYTEHFVLKDKMRKYLYAYFIKENFKSSEKHKRICSTSTAIREMFKITMRYYCTLESLKLKHLIISSVDNNGE